jgi:hypothetical protein
MERWEPVTRLSSNDPLAPIKNSNSSGGTSGDMADLAGAASLILVVVGVAIVIAWIIDRTVKLIVKSVRYCLRQCSIG